MCNHSSPPCTPSGARLPLHWKPHHRPFTSPPSPAGPTAAAQAYIERERGELQQLMKRAQSQEVAAANKLLKPLEAQIKAAAAGVANVKKAWNKKAKEAAQAAGEQPMTVA